MELREAEKHAKALMTLHGVGHLEFGFGRGKRMMGVCRFRRVVDASGQAVVLPSRIELSKHFVALLSEDEIRRTMLHEIAHALAGHKAGHGPEWKRVARSLGITPNRCETASARPERSAKGWCRTCEKVRLEQHRLPLSVYVCPKCKRDGMSKEAQVLVWFKNGTRVALKDMPVRYQRTLDFHLNAPVQFGIDFGIFD